MPFFIVVLLLWGAVGCFLDHYLCCKEVLNSVEHIWCSVLNVSLYSKYMLQLWIYFVLDIEIKF